MPHSCALQAPKAAAGSSQTFPWPLVPLAASGPSCLPSPIHISLVSLQLCWGAHSPSNWPARVFLSGRIRIWRLICLLTFALPMQPTRSLLTQLLNVVEPVTEVLLLKLVSGCLWVISHYHPQVFWEFMGRGTCWLCMWPAVWCLAPRCMYS